MTKVGIIPAAGAGHRMGYLGAILPKCLMPVFDRPILHRVLDNMAAMGVDDVYVMTYYHDAAIRAYIGSVYKDLSVDVTVVKCGNPTRGINETVLYARPYVQEDFVLMQGDDVTVATNLQELEKKFHSTEAMGIEAVIRGGDIKRACEVHMDGDRVTKVIEKPKLLSSGLRGAGIYVFQPQVFDVMLTQGDWEISTTMNKLAQNNAAYGYHLDGYNINVNTPYDLMEAGYICYQESLPR